MVKLRNAGMLRAADRYTWNGWKQLSSLGQAEGDSLVYRRSLRSQVLYRGRRPISAG